MPRFDWTVVIEQPYDEAFAPIVSSMSRVAALNLVIVLGVGRFQGTILAQGTPDEIRNHDDPMVQQFINGHADGPIPLRLSKGDYINRLLGNA